MPNNRDRLPQRLMSLAFIAGGLLMAGLWLVFATVHGPTSYDETRMVLGRSTLFWGRLLGGPPNLLLALGLAMLYPPLAGSPNRLARVGYALAVGVLIVSAGIDLYVWQALGPPFFIPVVGLGLILLAFGTWPDPHWQRLSLHLLMFTGMVLVISFPVALIPLDVSDSFGGYRVFGVLAYLVPGLGWAALGVNFGMLPVPAPAIDAG